MTDLQHRRSRKMGKQTEIKQESSNSEEHEDYSVKSVTPPNHFNSQIAIKQEGTNTSSQAEEDGVHLNITSLTFQVKIEPQSEEEGGEMENLAGDYPDGFVIKREIIEGHTEDCPMKTTRDEYSGTEANDIIKSENDNWSPNFPDNNIDKQNNIFDLTKKMNKQETHRTIAKKTKMFHTQAKSLCQTSKRHKCSVCAKTFKSSQACLQHMWKTHTVENPYTCEVCKKGFPNLRRLQMHKAVHSDEKSFSCNVCNKAFKQKRVLHHHKMCHSDERPYPCDLCNKAFKYERYLQNHKMQCHTDERPYFCEVCKKMFKRKTNLIRHKRRVHSDERPYKCDVCDKAFKQNCVLQTHKVWCHSDEKPAYSCDMCKKTFNRKGNLNKHKRTVHSDE